MRPQSCMICYYCRLKAADERSLPALFASVLVCIINIRKGGPDIQIVCKHRARFNMQVLHRFQDTWPTVIWTRHLLDGLLKISNEQPLPEPVSADVDGNWVPSTANDRNRPSRNPEVQSVYHEAPDLYVEGMAGLSPPSSTNDGQAFSYGLGDGLISGFPVSFPFNNLFEEVGFGSETFLGNE